MARIEIALRHRGKRLTMPAATSSTFAILRQFARVPRSLERCELCSAALAHEHPHLVQLISRQIVCACEACATLFDGMAGGKYRRVSRRAQLLANFQITDAQWENLLIPINMASSSARVLKNELSHFIQVRQELWNHSSRLMPGVKSSRKIRHSTNCSQISKPCSSPFIGAHELSQGEYYIAPI